MRGFLAKLGLRGVLIVGLAVVVLAIVSVARLADKGGSDRFYTSVPMATSTVDPTSGDDGEVVSPSAYPDDTAVRTASESFIRAWLKRDLSPGNWLAGLKPMITDTLAESLQGVDPSTVPASRVTAPPTIVLRTDSFAQTSTTVDTGTLILGLSKHDIGWLVDSVDWDRV